MPDETAQQTSEQDKYEGMTTEEIIAAESYQKGVRTAVKALTDFIDASDVAPPGWDTTRIEVWFAHIVNTSARCECDLTTDYDATPEVTWCKWYADSDNRREWYRTWIGLTEEELREQEQVVAAVRARMQQEQEARARAHRLIKLHELAREFNVDPKLLP